MWRRQRVQLGKQLALERLALWDRLHNKVGARQRLQQPGQAGRLLAACAWAGHGLPGGGEVGTRDAVLRHGRPAAVHSGP